MALIYKPCTYPQMQAKCCHDLLYKRSFHSSSQRANWGELNHHITQGNADLTVPAIGKAVKAALCARGSGFHSHTHSWNVHPRQRESRDEHQQQASCRTTFQKALAEHIFVKWGHKENLAFKHNTKLQNRKFG